MACLPTSNKSETEQTGQNNKAQAQAQAQSAIVALQQQIAELKSEINVIKITKHKRDTINDPWTFRILAGAAPITWFYFLIRHRVPWFRKVLEGAKQ